MSSNAEASPRAMCKATTKAGVPCRKKAVERGFCVFHSGKLDLAELGRRGGRARGRKKEEAQPGDRLEALAHAAIEKLLTGSGSATAQAQVAKLVVDRISSNSPLSAELAKRAVYAEIAAEREMALPAARGRLARLVEREAQAKADALTEERIAERVERRAEEKYRERMKAETEAVKAEMAEAPAAEDPPAELEGP